MRNGRLMKLVFGFIRDTVNMLYFKPCILFFIFACWRVAESGLVDDLKSHVGIGVNPDSSVRNGAIILLSNASSDGTVDPSSWLSEEDIFDLGSSYENDPESLFLHFDGDNLVTSKADQYNDLDESSDSWSAVLNTLKTKQNSGSFGDLIILDSYPEHVAAQVSEVCTGKECKVFRAYIERTSPSSVRSKRANDETTTATPKNSIPAVVKANIPVMEFTAAFQLLFWTSTILALTVWGVSYGMWHMDPGRDSIIYRMTSSQKYKKDK